MPKGKKWCDLCKIFIINQPSKVKIHELTRRHKDHVTKRQSNMRELSKVREKKVAKDKGKKKASGSSQNDISTFQKASNSNATSLGAQISSEGLGDGYTMFGDWERDVSLGYYYNRSNGCYFDPNSGFYYTDALGKWVTLKEALAATSKPIQKKPNLATSSSTSKSQTKSKTPLQNGQHHKNNVTKKRRQDKAAKEKEKMETALVLTQIKEKESRSDILIIQKERDGNETSLSSEEMVDLSTMFGDWEREMSSGYYYNRSNGCYFDPNSGLYYPRDSGKWVTLKEALSSTSKTKSPTKKSAKKPSSLYINKRKQPNSKPKVVSKKEAREAARKRVEDMEKPPIIFTYSRKRKR
ncbi:hypothetical protein L2E82_02139 [Cichorium intybus]|uniref:Uncharacterized protein n=1 Tax=Cichorium intybus TaxID=13427 RepID=A0ACB9H201_CICIN|nr:hypothetical protein L2E82_02139 [Cichorium intybus]